MKHTITSSDTQTCWGCGAPIRTLFPSTTDDPIFIIRNLDGTPHHCPSHLASQGHEARLQEFIALLRELPPWCTDVARGYIDALRQKKLSRIATQEELRDEWWEAEWEGKP